MHAGSDDTASTSISHSSLSQLDGARLGTSPFDVTQLDLVHLAKLRHPHVRRAHPAADSAHTNLGPATARDSSRRRQAPSPFLPHSISAGVGCDGTGRLTLAPADVTRSTTPTLSALHTFLSHLRRLDPALRRPVGQAVLHQLQHSPDSTICAVASHHILTRPSTTSPPLARLIARDQTRQTRAERAATAPTSPCSSPRRLPRPPEPAATSGTARESLLPVAVRPRCTFRKRSSSRSSRNFLDPAGASRALSTAEHALHRRRGARCVAATAARGPGAGKRAAGAESAAGKRARVDDLFLIYCASAPREKSITLAMPVAPWSREGSSAEVQNFELAK